MNNLIELPEKWCVKANRDNWIQLRDFICSKGYPSWSSYTEYCVHFPFIGSGGSLYSSIQGGYTEITFKQFKEWVLEEKPQESLLTTIL